MTTTAPTPTPRPPVVATGRGLKFSVFGFPVNIDLSFFLIGAVIGFQVVSLRWEALLWIAMFLVVIAASVLVHELGHAFAARSLGAHPTIRLHVMGGVTHFMPPSPPTRLQTIGVSLAGPFAGFALGLIVLLARQVVDDPVSGSLEDNAWRFLILINLGWGAINLAPVLPLDGGHVMESLMPGDELRRRRIAALMSVLVGVALTWFFWKSVDNMGIAAFLFALFAAQNVGVLLATTSRSTKRDEDRDALESAIAQLNTGDNSALLTLESLARESSDPTVQKYSKMLVVERSATGGNVAQARAQLTELPGAVHPALYGLVALHEGDPSAIEQLDDAMHSEPSPAAAHILTLGYIGAGRANDVVTRIGSGPATWLTPSILGSVQHTLHSRNFVDAGVQVGELHLATVAEPAGKAFYNTACGWARSGNSERAMTRLSEAIDRGWNDRATLDADPDFAPYRHTVEYGALRGRLS